MEPTIYTQDQHGIAIDDIDRHALYVMEKLQAAGYIAYLVGGGVRDLLIGTKPKDFDISTSAKPEEVKKIFRNCLLIGRRFRLAHIRFGKKVLEVSTFRQGDNEDDQLILRDNEWGTPQEDVLRRDFTINGLFYNSEDETVIDFVDGYPDAKKKFLRTIGQPHLRFKQDPVRMIRLLKFQARFGCDVCPETHQALLDCRGDILKSAQARVLEELLRMTESSSAKPFFELMTKQGMLQALLPALSEFLETPLGGEVYEFLEEADRLIADPTEEKTIERPVLLACFVMPMLKRHFSIHIEKHNKVPHLGLISNEICTVLDTLFKPFFHIPRRIRTSLLFLLTAQFRMTPLDAAQKRRIRIPGTPDFHLALDFLELRARLEPGLQETWQSWKEAFEKNPPEPSRYRRNRPRRSRS
ncbi:MAG: polynucleotide adenylyltransferase PcnB [Simkaniaceae bacterium]|nr:polynucleotide adenylyltransferase PcnB [Simkaniaceae bacterium]